MKSITVQDDILSIQISRQDKTSESHHLKIIRNLNTPMSNIGDDLTMLWNYNLNKLPS